MKTFGLAEIIVTRDHRKIFLLIYVFFCSHAILCFHRSFSTQDRLHPCVERIVERRYYVKKAKPTATVNQLTSTTDLNCYEKRLRQFSAISSITAASDPCSQCNTSKPAYVEEFREQSESLRREILELKTEIQHLHSTQGYFLQQFRAASNNEAQARGKLKLFS